MNYILKPSLKNIALVKIGVTLWNQDDVRDIMAEFCIPFRSTALKDEWHKIEDRVKKKVMHLPLPELLKNETLCFIRPLGFQILRWMKHHGDAFLNIDLPDEFVWTSQGILNEKKVAKMLVEDESIDHTTRYKISCVYCLEDDVLKLWDKVPEDSKKSFYCREDSRFSHQHNLVLLWTYDIKGEIAEVGNLIEGTLQHRCSPYQYALECAAKHGNRAAIEYFVQKLTSGERKESLIKIAGFIAYGRMDTANKCTTFLDEYYSDILCILLSHMNEEQQIEVFKNFPYQVLICFLDFPWQNFFIETASRTWNFLPEEVYDVLLGRIIDKITHGYNDFNYQKLFVENWQQSPYAYKKYIFNNREGFFQKIFKCKNENLIKLVFKDATFEEKKNILYSSSGEDIFMGLIYSKEWALLRFFLKECLSSKDEMIEFKKTIQEYISIRSSYELRKEKSMWVKLFNIFDEFISGFNELKCVED